MDSSVLMSLSDHDSLMVRVRKALEEAIVRNELRPGERLKEIDLGNRFGISRAPIREAFRALESEGLIVNHPRRGFVVAPLNFGDAQDLYEVRPLLEGPGARLAAGNRNHEFLSGLRAAIEKMRAAMQRNDVVAFTLADAEFHRLIYENSKNQVLIDMLNNIWRRCFRYLLVTNSHRGELKSAFERHLKLLKAVSEETPVTVQRITERNLRAAKRLLLLDLRNLGIS